MDRTSTTRPSLVAATVALGTALVFAACRAGASPAPSPTVPPAGSPTPSPNEPARLDGRAFLSTSVIQGGAERPLVAGTSIRLDFNDGRIGASAGCNLFGGDYRLDGIRLIVTGGAMTEMGCDDARHAQDDWLFGFLGAGPNATLAGSELTLVIGDTLIRLIDREVAQPDLPLVGPTWTVDSIVAGDTVSSALLGVSAWLRFTADGRFEMETGCNAGGGRVMGDETTLRFSEIATTKRACDGPEGDMEFTMLAVLSGGPVAYTIESDTLRFSAGGRGLILKGG